MQPVDVNHWYCPTCKSRLEPINITFEETCDRCGTRAEWVTIPNAQKEYEKIKEKFIMSKKKCEKCGTISSSNYCPDCGNKLVTTEDMLPYTFVTYLHGNGLEDDAKVEAVKELGLWDNKFDAIVDEITGCDYEIKFTWEVTSEGTVILKSVNDIPLANK